VDICGGHITSPRICLHWGLRSCRADR